MEKITDTLINFIIKYLPLDPFKQFLEGIKETLLPFLGGLNYFVPVKAIRITIFAFIGAYIIYLAYSVIMRWLKMIR